MQSENLYWVWLASRLGAACVDFPRLMLKYDNPYDIYTAGADELSSVESVGMPTVRKLCDKSLDAAIRIVEFCSKTGVCILPYSDERYPNRLRILRDPPVLLYVRGNMPDMDKRVCIAMVGTRRMSEYGRGCAYKIAYELGAAGAVVVSGMALGIDGVAAGGAINGGGETIAVLGSGIDVVYPREHGRLMSLISENGAVVTEYAPGTPPAGEHFPLRNRIISGMCQGTLVVEADEHSGAMITARDAVTQGRQLFAIPGNLGEENTSGTNLLIRDGAIIVIETKDILREYEYLYGNNIDTARLLTAQKRYSFSEETLTRMGVFARYSPRRSSAAANTPSAPREAFERGTQKNATDAKPKTVRTVKADKTLTAHEYIGGAGAKVSSGVALKAEGDDSAALLGSLDERYRKIFAEIPDDRAITADTLTKLGFSIGEVMTAMTMLEVKGLISSLPGGLYIKR